MSILRPLHTWADFRLFDHFYEGSGCFMVVKSRDDDWVSGMGRIVQAWETLHNGR